MRLLGLIIGAALAGLSLSATATAAPYLRGPIDNGSRSAWRMTPDDPSRFPLVAGPSGSDAVGLATTPFGTGPNSQSVMAARWVHPELAHAGWENGRRVEGQDTWYRVRMMFPSGRYVPTRGEWNWVVEWHNDDRTAAIPRAYSIALGVYTDFAGPEGSPGVNPRLAFRLMGGRAQAPSVRTVELPRGSLLLDHWYDLTFHIVWSADGKAGLAEWWCDGTRVASLRFPTLYTLPGGGHSYNNFGVYNYRLRSGWPSEVHVGEVAIGPDAPSVGAQLIRMDASSALARLVR
jgi:hypothetical protein